MTERTTRQVHICNSPMSYPTEVVELRDSAGIRDEPAALRARMAEWLTVGCDR